MNKEKKRPKSSPPTGAGANISIWYFLTHLSLYRIKTKSFEWHRKGGEGKQNGLVNQFLWRRLCFKIQCLIKIWDMVRPMDQETIATEEFMRALNNFSEPWGRRARWEVCGRALVNTFIPFSLSSCSFGTGLSLQWKQVAVKQGCPSCSVFSACICSPFFPPLWGNTAQVPQPEADQRLEPYS